MTYLQRRSSPHRRRRIHHNRFPYVRFATVLAVSKRSPFSPSLLLRGDWLTEAGFLPYCRVRITVHAQRLVLEPLIGVGVGVGDSSSPL
ncbi:MAG: type I toxin-antitoxin system SymE family toxin, partial [Burkholderiales bacterium]|nr:type I toxin-antitoxin system SymE family toxin [Burkholderiales bacterium]